MSKIFGKHAGSRPAPTSESSSSSFRSSPHRSVNAHAIRRLQTNVAQSTNTDTRLAALAQLWEQCASQDTYVSSLASQALVELAVQQNRLPWSEVFQGLEDVLSTVVAPSLMNTIHAVSRLLTAAAKNDTLIAGSNVTKNMFKGKNRRHPFIHLVLNKPGVEAILLAEVEAILEGHGLDLAEKYHGFYRVHALDALETFLDFCLLDRHERTTALIAPALVNWINRVLNLATEEMDTQEPFVVHLLEYLTTLPLRIPLDRHSPGTTLFSILQSLVDFYRLPSTQSSLNTHLKTRVGNNILLAALTWTCDMRRYGQPTLPWIQTLERLVRPRRAYTAPALPLALQWVAYSYLLMDSPTVAEQELIVGWMHRLAVGQPEPLPVVMANFAFLPLFQAMGESKLDNVSKRCTEILQVLERTSREDNIQDLETTTREAITTTTMNNLTQGTLGALHAEILHLSANWATLASSVDEESPLDRYTLHDDDTLPSLVLATLMFHPDPNVRKEAITRQASIEKTRLVTLVLFLHLLRTDPSASVQLFLLQEAIPSLVTSKDEYVTAKVLRTILSLIQGQAAVNAQQVANTGMAQRSKYTHLSAVGVRIMYLMWLRQPRVWKSLRQVVFEWVESRTRLHKPPRRGSADYDMEISVLTTIRDICAKNAASHAEVLIPFMATLLKSVELHPNSICLILESLNISVRANVVEPRAAWNVLICHVAEHARKIGYGPLHRVLCTFYGIAGSRTEETQVYLEFKQAILENYIRPLLDSQQPKVLGAALRALSSFTAAEIQSILPVESPTLFIRQLILEAPTELVVDEYALLINRLARHELANLRRSLFKDAAGGRSATHQEGVSASAAKQSLDRTQLITKAVAQNMLQKWQRGAVLPGLRMGYALSNLYCSAMVTTSKMSLDAQEAIRTEQPYRDVMAQIKDIALTDHLLVRLSAVDGWSARFDSLWVPEDDSQTLVVLETLIPDLKQQLVGGHVPAHCANTIFAMTGVVLSLYRVAHPAATVQASTLAQYLLDHFVYPQGAKNEMAGSDEVQFAVLMGLAHVTPLAAVDERLVRTVIRAFMDRLDQDAQTPSNASSELSNWAVFAAGWGLCALLAGLLDSPTRTSDLTLLCRESMRTVVSTIESKTASFELTLGLVIGFSRLTAAVSMNTSASHVKNDDCDDALLQQSSDLGDMSESQLVERTLVTAHADLDQFLSNTQQGFDGAHALARFLGAAWLLAYSTRHHLTHDAIAATTAKLDQVLLAMTSRRDLQTHLVHITVPYCHVLQINLDTRSPASAEITALTSRVHSLVNLIRITPTSAARHTAVLALAACLGVNWCSGPFSSAASGSSSSSSRGSGGLFAFLATQPSLISVLYSALNTLIEQSGLQADLTVYSILTAEGITLDPSVRAEPKSAAPTARPGGQSLMSMDLKAGRLAALVLGKFSQLIQQLAAQDVGKVVGSSNEPRDYSRLPHSSSWLRALWEGMWEPLQLGTVQRVQRQATFATCLTLLLETVRSLPLPLPAVNWFPLLNQLVELEPQLLVATVRLAARHAMTSTSLMEYLVMVMANFKSLGSTKIAPSQTAGAAEGANQAEIEQAEAREILVGEEGLGRLLALAGLPWLDHSSGNSKNNEGKKSRPKDRVAAELDKVRGLDTIAKRVHLPISRAYELVESIVRVLFPAAGNPRTESEAEMEGREVLQLILLDTLQHHLPKPRPSTAGGGNTAKTAVEGGTKESTINSSSNSSSTLVHELRTLLTQVYYQYRIADGRVVSNERVLRRLANLSFTSISHLDAMPPPSTTTKTPTIEEDARQIVKEAIGLASLYRAGLLTATQENRMVGVAQKAIAHLGGIHHDGDQGAVEESMEMAFSVLLHAMWGGSGVGFNKAMQHHNSNHGRFVWLQRILDLLILITDTTPKLMLGIRWLLSGAALLWWDRQELALRVRQGAGDGNQDALSSTETAPSFLRQSGNNSKQDADAQLLDMVDDDEEDDEGDLVHEDGDDGFDPEDENPMMDSLFDEWHVCYLEQLQSGPTQGVDDAQGELTVLLNRMTLILPDVVLQHGVDSGYVTANLSSLTAVADHPAGQVTKRLLQLVQERAVQPHERQFFIRILRRLEKLIPDEAKWVLLAPSA